MLILLESNLLQICLNWKEKILAFSNSLKIPLSDIAGVESYYKPTPNGIRMPGSYIPRIITAGSYYTKVGWEFWFVQRKKKILRIELKNQFYSRLILGVDNNSVRKKKLEK